MTISKSKSKSIKRIRFFKYILFIESFFLTSKHIMDCFEEIGKSENLQPFILSKFSISMSIKQKNKLSDTDFHTDSNGLELNRQTITEEYDVLFKALIEDYENISISDDDYVKIYLKAHLNRGASFDL